MSIRVKICGLKRPEHVAAAVEGGAAYVGFVFFPRSPRAITPAEAVPLALEVPPGIAKVALTVDADDATLDELLTLVPLDMLQLHGSESPERVAEVRQRFGLPVMKAVGFGGEEDIPTLEAALQAADQVLVDAKPPKHADRPGGHGMPFDWRLLTGRRWPVPWMLAGGLTPGNVAEAVALTGARQVDVSTGVEKVKGEKDVGLIRAFLEAAR